MSCDWERDRIVEDAFPFPSLIISCGMQHQQTRNATQSVSQTQSLAAVQTLLRAGLGTITFLRNLLPEDNFTRSHFTSVEEPEGGSSQPDGSQESMTSRKNVNGFRIMTITRGYTDEADRLLNYLEYGIFDALEKRYLRSFIFGIYLDTKDPNNIVEAYTFNFKYYTVPGSGIVLPMMSLGDGHNSFSKHSRKTKEDPIAKAIKNGKAPTLRDVKLSVKTLLKTLIQAMNNMDILPRRRFATFKVFYTDQTPLDYEPPNFQAGDVDKDRWYFMTHDLDEVPDRCSIGKIETGHHSVNLSVTSIASFLPSSTEHDDAIFSGTTSISTHLSLTPHQEATACKDQAEKQLEDAEKRNVVWPVEDCIELSDPDAEGEDDPDYLRQPDGIYVKVDTIAPIGFRNKEGNIDPVALQEHAEARFEGVSENAPRYLHEIATEQNARDSNFEETQPLLLTPKTNTMKRPTSLTSAASFSSVSTPPTSPFMGFDPEMMKNMSLGAPEAVDIEMLDFETQRTHEGARQTLESIQSFPETVKGDSIQNPSLEGPEQSDSGLQCECGISTEAECCFCEGGCKRWFHVWCMGYHATDDPRMPTQFICFDCRIRADITWELIKIDLYPRMLTKFKDLALFRRAIKVAQKEESFSSKAFSNSYGGDAVLAGQMLKRLVDEEFVLQESVALDDMGLLVTTRTKKNKTKGKEASKHPKTRKNMQKVQYVFNYEIEEKPQYLENFMPNDQAVETRLIGLAEMTQLGKLSRTPRNAHEETQTQEDTQYPAIRMGNAGSESAKRVLPQNELNPDSELARPLKKIKMSVALGVDLAE
ncbi:hypothetical protein M413DRAFT_86715 [Hebeloma cylindrosporum]|uniref:HORMA domain-containing protein n=1 Tax=Hebeloma cylindrosporum TaxID=76867 RepID=A0A0C2Z6J6_HEBCY|nr:hypothetical protein M413DRAFT_86715 [Hebeloma cylindrosporum h7]